MFLQQTQIHDQDNTFSLHLFPCALATHSVLITLCTSSVSRIYSTSAVQMMVVLCSLSRFHYKRRVRDLETPPRLNNSNLILQWPLLLNFSLSCSLPLFLPLKLASSSTNTVITRAISWYSVEIKYTTFLNGLTTRLLLSESNLNIPVRNGFYTRNTTGRGILLLLKTTRAVSAGGTTGFRPLRELHRRSRKIKRSIMD